MFNWLRNLLLIVVLIAIIVLSFWISFMIGKRMLTPVKKLPTSYMLTEESRSILPPEITLEVEGLTFETTPFETRHKAEKKAPEKKTIVEKRSVKKHAMIGRTTAKKTRIAEPQKNIVPTAATGKYAVQVGAFSHRSNAQKLAGDLSAKGYANDVRRIGKLYRVDSGRFNSLSAAKAYLNKLGASGFEGIIRRDD